MHSSPIRSSHSAIATRLLSTAGMAAALIAVSACSATPTATTTTATEASTEPSTPATAPDQQDGGPGATARGVNGLIAAAQEGQLQVQGDGTQTTVRYTDATTVQTSATVDIGDLQVGDCVIAITGDDNAATTITVTAAIDGECGGGFGFGGGGFSGGGDGAGGDGAANGGPTGERPTDAPSGMPNGQMPNGQMPSGAPSGAPEGGFGGGDFGGFTVGAITAVTADSVTVASSMPDDEATTTTLAVGTDTTITATVDGSLDDITTGQCVVATGEADEVGGYDATSLSLSQPDADGTCTSGFGGGFAGGPGDGFAGGPAGGQGGADDE